MLNEKMKHKKALVQYFVVLLWVVGSVAFGQIAVPEEINSTITTFQNWMTGDVAKAIVGVCFAGSCIAYAYNKDNEKMKQKVMAVAIASGLLGMTQTLVPKFANIGAK